MRVLKSYGGIGGMPHSIFFGPPGTGKTSTILAIAKEFYGIHFDSNVIEINASDDRSVDIVTGRIRNFVQTRALSGVGIKLVVLDEADALTLEAQSALRRIMEKSTYDVRFCLCCNYIGKINAALQSRCARFRFEGMDTASLGEMAGRICNEENLDMSQASLDAVLTMSKGDARRVINLLQSIFLQNRETEVSEEDVYQLAGLPLPEDIDLFLHKLRESSFEDSHRTIAKIVQDKGYSIVDVVTDISGRILLSNLSSESRRLSTLFIEFANIEYNLSKGGSEKLAIAHLVSAFHLRLD
jgi:replication factor C subunit 3/5